MSEGFEGGSGRGEREGQKMKELDQIERFEVVGELTLFLVMGGLKEDVMGARRGGVGRELFHNLAFLLLDGGLMYLGLLVGDIDDGREGGDGTGVEVGDVEDFKKFFINLVVKL